MVDVVVDEKPMERLPYDPNDIPEAVRKRVAAVEALYSGGSVTPPPDAAESAPGKIAPPIQAPEMQVTSSPTPAPAPVAPDDPNSNTWKSRALSKEGRIAKELEQAKKDLGDMQEQYYREVTAHQRQLAQLQQQSRPQQQVPQFLTQQDLDNYGGELLDVQQRAALQVIAPHLQSTQARIDMLARENADLRAQRVQDNRRALDQQVEMAVPDYREFDANPRWHKWLLGIDLMSGRVRQQLLNEAISAGYAPRVVKFFNDFRNEEVATGHQASVPAPSPAKPPREAAVNLAHLASPGRARPASGGETASVSSDRPTYTPLQISRLYDQHRRGAYTGRETEWSRIERDIFAAQHEGRIRR